MKIAHYGTFDVPNYGDLLFPLVVESKLAQIDASVVHVSPVGGAPVYSDVPASVTHATAALDAFDAVIIGGGNILHSGRSSLPAYRTVRYGAYPSLWLDAAALARRQDIPLVINAPGAPKTFRWPAPRLLREVADQAAYFAVRDRFSLERLRAAGVNSAVIVPDTALQIAEVLPAPSTVVDRPGARQGRAAVHVNDRYGARDVGVLASELDRLSVGTELELTLIGIGPCHGDDLYAKRVGGQMHTSPALMPWPETVTSVAHKIAASEFYVGSSLHGFITATSYGVPAFLVADHRQQSKFIGLLEQLGTSECMFPSWTDAVDFLTSGEWKVAHASPVSQQPVNDVLNEHWRKVIGAIGGGNRPSGSARSLTAGLASLELRNAALKAAGSVRDKLTLLAQRRHVRS